MKIGAYERIKMVFDAQTFEEWDEEFMHYLPYIKDEKKNIANLMKYARERRVVKKVQSMIGVWL